MSKRHSPYVIHLSKSNYNKPQHQNIKNDSLSDHFRPQFSVTFLTKQAELPLCPNQRRIQKNSPLNFWPRDQFTVNSTLIMRNCLHGL